MSTENQHNNWSDALPALVLFLLHAVCCIGVALFVLLGGVGLSALLASMGFWAIGIGILAASIGGYWLLPAKTETLLPNLKFGQKNKIKRNSI